MECQETIVKQFLVLSEKTQRFMNFLRTEKETKDYKKEKIGLQSL
jgi:hypothetical protein